MAKSVHVRLGPANVTWDGSRLCVSTGEVERTWLWTGRGLATVGLRRVDGGLEWSAADCPAASDWGLPDGSAPPEARLVRAAVQRTTDEGFTSEHLRAAVTMDYPSAGLRVRFTADAYPGAPGIRTQLAVRALPHFDAAGVRPGAGDAARTDGIAASLADAELRAAGYYNDTQHRNRPDTPILREESLTLGEKPVVVDWANLLFVRRGMEGMVWVKESRKCVNQPGVFTGAFTCSRDGIEVTGWGMSPTDITPRKYLTAWAVWCVLWEGDDSACQLALKRFDRARFPVDHERDVYVMANTWGSTDNCRDAQEAAREENVLREIDSQADLGIDVQQIDDGWQGNQHRGWLPAPNRYPRGWENVVQRAREKGVILGLWAAGERISLEKLKWNYLHGGFRYYKLDFLNLTDRARVEKMMEKARRFVRFTGGRVRINWDVTENEPRVGYFFAREFGNIYLANRKPSKPENVVYIPYLVLRDAWHVARYVNLNKFQVSIQNIDRVDRERSNAWRYTHSYCVAVAFMGCPIFFQETHYYSERARAEIRSLLAVYKRVRHEMFDGFVFPIGDEPNDASWTGFQNHDPNTGCGFLLVFRELHNPDARVELRLHFAGGRELELEDLVTGAREIRRAAADGRVAFEMARAPGFRFLRYRLRD